MVGKSREQARFTRVADHDAWEDLVDMTVTGAGGASISYVLGHRTQSFPGRSIYRTTHDIEFIIEIVTYLFS